MANSLFQKHGKQGNNPLQALGKLRSMGPSNAIFEKMYSSNPEFRNFADSVRGKTPDEAFRQAGLNFDDFRHLRW